MIERIRTLAGRLASPDLRVGIGDDAAVATPPPASEEILATTDQVIENQHFLLDRHPPAELGRKSICRGLSDIAAMGGRPRWFLLSLVLPSRIREEWLDHFLQEMFLSALEFGGKTFGLAGGDVAAGESFAAHVTVIGSAPRGRALLRSGARPGDALYVSGSLGGSALGLDSVLRGELDESDRAVRRHWRPEPRIQIGEFLRERGATAAIDITDGLSTDLHRIAAASDAAFDVDVAALPRFPGASDEQVLHGGEEYELLFTAPLELETPAAVGGIPLTRIGACRSGSGVWLRQTSGPTLPLEPLGYDHFRPRA